MKKILIIMLLASCTKAVVSPTSSSAVETQSVDVNPVTYSTSDTIRIQASISQNRAGSSSLPISLLSTYLSKAIPDTITAVVQWTALNYSFIDTVKIAGVRQQSFSTKCMYYNEIKEATILSARVNNSKYILKY